MVEIENAMKTTLDRDYHKFIYQAQLQWDHAFSDNWDNRFHLGFGYWGSRDDQETMREKWDVWPLLIRDELTWRRGDKFILRVGTDTEFRWWKTKMKEPEYYGVEDELWDPSSSNDEWIESEGKRFHAQPSGYTELELTAIPNTRVIYGMRVDYDSSNKKWGIDPRVAIRYSPYVTTTLKAGLGLFHQPPGMAEGDKDQGNPDLDLTSAIHYSVGVEQKIFENVAIDVEGFYKDLRHMITTSDAMIARDGTLVPERYDTVGIGRAYGMEAQIKHSSNRFFGWIAYTLMKSERRDEAGAGWRPFDYDQTHILTLLGSLHVGWGIDVGYRFQLVTGNPITPVVGFNYDVDSEMYYPIWGDDNSDRLPVFHQLDLRVDKKWQWKWLALTIYMDVRNVYNHRNEEGIYFNWGESEKIPIYSLPILPSAGVRLEY
jgi:outer membrane receptor protein involved in Fe transport